MFSADKPIEVAKEDLLGRANFSKQLGQAIINFDSKDNIVIGMYGKWGTGKTSIINMALQEIDSITSAWNANEKPIILKFEPWNFTSNENLITQFFYLLREKINKKENLELKNCIGDALEQYSNAIEFASIIPQIGPLTSILKTTIAFTGDQLKKKCADKGIGSAKDELIKILEEQKKENSSNN